SLRFFNGASGPGQGIVRAHLHEKREGALVIAEGALVGGGESSAAGFARKLRRADHIVQPITGSEPDAVRPARLVAAGFEADGTAKPQYAAAGADDGGDAVKHALQERTEEGRLGAVEGELLDVEVLLHLGPQALQQFEVVGLVEAAPEVGQV